MESNITRHKKATDALQSDHMLLRTLLQQLVSIPKKPYLVGLDRHDIIHGEVLLGDGTLAMVLQCRGHGHHDMNLAKTVFPLKKIYSARSETKLRTSM